MIETIILGAAAGCILGLFLGGWMMLGIMERQFRESAKSLGEAMIAAQLKDQDEEWGRYMRGLGGKKWPTE